MLQLKKFPDIPVSTREEAQESCPHSDEPRFRLIAREERSFPAWSGKNSRRSRRISRGGALHRKAERNPRVVPPFPESPRCVSPFQGNLISLHCLDVQAEDRLTPRWHVGQPCGKASWESLVGKPRGKATDSLMNAKGSVTSCCSSGGKHTCMPPLEMRTDPLGRLQKYPKIHVSTGEEYSGSDTDSTQGLRPSIDGRGIPRGPRATRMGTGVS